MMKAKFSLTAILGAAALTTGVLFANPAASCPLEQVKGTTWLKNLPSLNPMQMGLLGVSSAAVLGAAGWLVAKKVMDTTALSSDESFNETSFAIHVPSEALETNTLEVEEEKASSFEPTSLG